MAITNAQQSTLDTMCLGANSALLGTALQTAQNNILTLQASTPIKAGKYTVLTADATAGTVTIPVGMTVTGFVVNILRAGKDTTNLAAISGSTTNLVVATNSTSYVLTAGDVINYIVY